MISTMEVWFKIIQIETGNYFIDDNYMIVYIIDEAVCNILEKCMWKKFNLNYEDNNISVNPLDAFSFSICSNGFNTAGIIDIVK